MADLDEYWKKTKIDSLKKEDWLKRRLEAEKVKHKIWGGMHPVDTIGPPAKLPEPEIDIPVDPKVLERQKDKFHSGHLTQEQLESAKKREIAEEFFKMKMKDRWKEGRKITAGVRKKIHGRVSNEWKSATGEE